jgi:hypothetical protein
MTHLPRCWRAFAVGLAAAATTVSMAQVANAAPAPPVVPPEIAVPNGNQVFLEGHTKDGLSFQIYRCDATPNGSTQFTWTFVRPTATLTGDNGQVIATHFAGPGGATEPTWQATDGSKVVGSQPVRFAQTGTIPLLRLTGTPKPVGGDGGRLGATTFIQRVNTKGGVADPAQCNADKVGTELPVPYSADYYFWKATGKPPKPTA